MVGRSFFKMDFSQGINSVLCDGARWIMVQLSLSCGSGSVDLAGSLLNWSTLQTMVLVVLAIPFAAFILRWLLGLIHLFDF